MAAALGLSPTLINSILAAFRGSTFTVPAFYVQLHTAVPGVAGTTALASGDNTRKAVVFSPPANHAIALTGNPPSWTNGGVVGEIISHWSGWSQSSGGTFYESGALDTPITWSTSDTIVLSTLSLPLTPVAAT